MLHVERSGDGDPVVFLHGAAGSSATYGWLPDLGRTVVRPDFRGHGRSRRADSYVLDDYVEDALEVLRETGPAPLVGHSLGGVVAWTVAQRRPDLVTGLVLEDPPLYMGEPEEHARNGAIQAFVALRAAARRWQAEGISREQAAAELAEQRNGRESAEDAISARAHSLLHVDVHVIDAIVDGRALASTDTLSPVNVPALLLAADVGAAFPPEHERRLARTHPAVTVRRITGSGHSIHDETAHRTAYLRAVAECLDS